MGPVKIAVVFIAEPYQCYHGAAVGIELAATPGVEVTIYYNDPATPDQVERIRRAYGADKLPYVRLERGPFTRFMQSLKWFGYLKPQVLRANTAALWKYDAVFTVEDTVYRLFDGVKDDERPRKIYLPHGAGDGIVGFSPRTKKFDFVLPPGEKTANRMLQLGYIRPGNYAIPGLVKLETVARLNKSRPPLFDNDRPIVLYNSHKTRGLASWKRFIEPLISEFRPSQDFNLIVAPHVKLFRRRSAAYRRRWEARSSANIRIDTGSDASMDMSYTQAASIYVGDISSQVYEYLTQPKPCVFINAYNVDWRSDPSFAHWHLGDVISRPSELMPAIRSAASRHHLYRDRQLAMAAASLGDCSPGAARRAANAIVEFMRR
jgi:hypothetical protein